MVSGNSAVWCFINSRVSFFALFCTCSMYILTTILTVKLILRCGIKQQKAPHEILDCFKGVVPRKAQLGFCQALSENSVVLENFLKIGLDSDKI